MAGNEGTSITDLWHYAVGSERKGPVPQATLGKLLASGEISAETYVWQPGMDNWVHLGDAPPLRSLVAAFGGDRTMEVFVEEDTAFNTANELIASHSELEEVEPTLTRSAFGSDDEEDDDGGPLGGRVSEDTVVETVDDVFNAIAVDYRQAAKSLDEDTDLGDRPGLLAGPSTAQAARPAAVLPRPAAQAAPVSKSAPRPAAAQSAADSGLVAGGMDIFGDAEARDIFAEEIDEPRPVAGQVGAHSRHVNSVLFSLDDLGRERGAAPARPVAHDPFVTDTSGLIDIKAIADSQDDKVERPDPFAVGSPIVAPRPLVGTVAVPIVARRSNNGPWILAAALLLLVGGGVAVWALTAKDKGDEPTPAMVAAAGTTPAGGARSAEAEAEAAKAAEAARAAEIAAAVEAARAEEAAKAAEAVKAAELERAAKAAEEARLAAEAAKVAEEAKVAEAAKVGRTADGAAKAGTAKAGATKVASKDPEPETPPVATIEVAEAPKTTPSTGNTRKVNALLEKLNNPGESATTAETGDTSLPKKLSAASLRQTLRANNARFARCGASLGAGAGSVKVSTSFVIQGSTGEVQSARITDAGGTSADVQRCVVSELKNTVFGRFSDPTMTVNFPIQLL